MGIEQCDCSVAIVSDPYADWERLSTKALWLIIIRKARVLDRKGNLVVRCSY